MNNRLFLYLSQTRVFWWLRAAMARIYFWIERKVFGVRYSLKEEKTNYQSLRHLFLITQKPLFIAIGVAAICQYVDPYLVPYYQKVGIRGGPTPLNNQARSDKWIPAVGFTRPWAQAAS